MYYYNPYWDNPYWNIINQLSHDIIINKRPLLNEDYLNIKILFILIF